MLSLKDIVVHYGGVHALKSISMEIAGGSITCLIGSNGAGKSTTLRAVSGMVPLTSGEIRFQGRRIDGMPPEEIVELGIGHVPEGKKLFLAMNVRDNLLAGAYLRRNTQRITADLERVCQYFPVLGTAINRPASQMSGGEQQMLAIGRGLMSNPKLLLLDEPSLGLSPLLTQEVGKIIRRIADEGMSILLIEQNASLALKLAQKCYVLETGVIAVEGNSTDLRNNPHVKAAYLGIDADKLHTKMPSSPRNTVSGSLDVPPPSKPTVRQHESESPQTNHPETMDAHDHQLQGRPLGEISLNYHTMPALSDTVPPKRDHRPVWIENTQPTEASSPPRNRQPGINRSKAKVVKSIITPMRIMPKNER